MTINLLSQLYWEEYALESHKINRLNLSLAPCSWVETSQPVFHSFKFGQFHLIFRIVAKVLTQYMTHSSSYSFANISSSDAWQRYDLIHSYMYLLIPLLDSHPVTDNYCEKGKVVVVIPCFSRLGDDEGQGWEMIMNEVPPRSISRIWDPTNKRIQDKNWSFPNLLEVFPH